MTALAFDAVTVRYGAVTAAENLTLHIADGERVALLGPSGAGKSTLLRLAAGRVAADHGTVQVFGQEWTGLSERDERRMRARVAVIHQQLDLVGPLRVVHNVNAGRLGSWSTWRAVRSLLRPVEVEQVTATLSQLGLGDRLDQRTDRLSGGEQQRVAVARALRQRGDLVLADEPVASVDPVWRSRVLDLLIDDCAARQATLVASLHDVDLALERFTRAVGISGGRIVFDLATTDVSPERLHALYTPAERV